MGVTVGVSTGVGVSVEVGVRVFVEVALGLGDGDGLGVLDGGGWGDAVAVSRPAELMTWPGSDNGVVASPAPDLKEVQPAVISAAIHTAENRVTLQSLRSFMM